MLAVRSCTFLFLPGAILFVVMRGRLQRVSDPSAELNVGISPTAIGQESDSPRV